MIAVCNVAPFAGAWIEILDASSSFSLSCVAPFAGAWIEILLRVTLYAVTRCRSLRGSVD